MRSFVVVIEPPQLSHLANPAQRLEQISVHELVTVRAIEAHRKSDLLRLASLDINHIDAMGLAPVSDGAKNEFGTVI